MRRASRTEVKTCFALPGKCGRAALIGKIVHNVADFVKLAFAIIPAGGGRIVVAPHVFLLQREMYGQAFVQVAEEALKQNGAAHPSPRIIARRL
jgi:hypothetical protein